MARLPTFTGFYYPELTHSYELKNNYCETLCTNIKPESNDTE